MEFGLLKTKDKIQSILGEKVTADEQSNSPIKESPSDLVAKRVAPSQRTEVVNFPLRMPKDLHQGLKHRAWHSQKSLHQHILDTLKKSGRVDVVGGCELLI